MRGSAHGDHGRDHGRDHVCYQFCVCGGDHRYDDDHDRVCDRDHPNGRACCGRDGRPRYFLLMNDNLSEQPSIKQHAILLFCYIE